MATYSLHRPHLEGHTGKPIVHFDCENDEIAIRQAASLAKVTRVEVWEGLRQVATLRPLTFPRRPNLRVITGGKALSP